MQVMVKVWNGELEAEVTNDVEDNFEVDEEAFQVLVQKLSVDLTELLMNFLSRKASPIILPGG